MAFQCSFHYDYEENLPPAVVPPESFGLLLNSSQPWSAIGIEGGHLELVSEG